MHFIVPSGALSADGQQWLSSRVNFVVPVCAASVIYRAKFQAIMRERGLHDRIPPVRMRAGVGPPQQQLTQDRLTSMIVVANVIAVVVRSFARHGTGSSSAHAFPLPASDLRRWRREWLPASPPMHSRTGIPEEIPRTVDTHLASRVPPESAVPLRGSLAT